MYTRTLKEYVELQKYIMLRPTFVKKVQKSIGHNPTRNEIADYWITNGYAQAFQAKYRIAS